MLPLVWLYLGLLNSQGFSVLSSCLQYGWVAFRLSGGLVNICWLPSAPLSSTMGFGLLSADCEACGDCWLPRASRCAEKSRRLLGARCTSADFQVPFCFLQQGISYCILSAASPYEVEAVHFAIKVLKIPETYCIISNTAIVWSRCS